MALWKLIIETGLWWIVYMPSILWADWNTVRSTIDITPFWMMQGVEEMLSIKLEISM